MSYLNQDVRPFDTVTISGNNTVTASGNYLLTTVFDTPSQDWASFNTTSKKIETSVDTFATAIYSPNSNPYGILTYQTPPTDDLVIRGQVLPVSTTGGSQSRGDDQAYYINNEHLFQYRTVSAGSTQTPDLTRSVLILMTIGV